MFAGDRFAGTLSPALMDSRTDGAFQAARLASPFHLTGDFVRYTAQDPSAVPRA